MTDSILLRITINR